MNILSTKKLNNGIEIPYLGLGVFRSEDGEETYNAVRWALDAGYRHIDTAKIYGNEASVGRAIADSGVAREEIFLTTKLWNEDMRQGRQLQAFQESLDLLLTDYVDLYLIHWPVKGKYVESWKAMEEIYASGRAKAVGVSNFHQHHLEDIAAVSDLVPAVNQIECHPRLSQEPLRAYCESKGIAFEAWSPLGGSINPLVKEDAFIAIGKKYGKSAAQVILRWDLQRDIITIPKSVHQNYIQQNAQIFDFELSAEDMAAIDAMNRNERVGGDPDNFNF